MVHHNGETGIGLAPPLFLTNDFDGVMLERYRSGDVTQMWTTVDVDYPTIPRVTSSSGVDIGGVFGCLAHVLSGGCPFSVTVGVVAKVVNRAGGGALCSALTTTPSRSPAW